MFWVKDRVTNVFSLISGENVFSAWHSNLIVSLLKNYISQPQTKCEFLPISLMMKMMTMTTMMVMTMMMMMMNHSSAPSPPGRVVAVSGGTGDLLVAWTPPKQPNGRLLQYTVTLIFKKHWNKQQKPCCRYIGATKGVGGSQWHENARFEKMAKNKGNVEKLFKTCPGVGRHVLPGNSRPSHWTHVTISTRISLDEHFGSEHIYWQG